MDKRKTALERAFELAASGTYASLSDVKARLKFEGYGSTSFVGPALNKQLRELVARSRSAHVAD